MEKREYEKMFALEEGNWWFRGKRRIVFSFISKLFKNSKGASALDVGCGTGIVAKALQKYGSVSAIDYSREAVEFCRQRGIPTKQADISKLPFSPGSFNLITCLDVLYHKGVKDDAAAAKEIYRVCKKGGYAFFTDSANMSLWSGHDIAVHAKKRYSLQEFTSILQQAGFTIEKASYWNFFLFPLVYLIRKLKPVPSNPKKAKSDVIDYPWPISKTLESILAIEAFLLKFVNLPFGVTLFCIARKN